MPDIFISYASQDTKVANDLADRLIEEDGWTVFLDKKIAAGAEWSEELLRNLNNARCVIVLWSQSSAKSFWVRSEAAEAFERGVYFPVTIDGSSPPKLLNHIQAKSISRWVTDGEHGELERLRADITSRIGVLRMYGNLERVAEDEPVTDRHLHLVHSCWRVDKNTKFGRMPYQVHLIVFGHSSALERIESVEYRLPGYPAGHDAQLGGPSERLYELKELANGFSIAQAHVRIGFQPPGHSKIVRLSRLVNMSESGPRLLDDFVVRQESFSRYRDVLHSLPDALEKASKLLVDHDCASVVKLLIADGYPEAMAESAAATANGRANR